MKNETEYIDDLIGKYLAGEASGDEAATVETWIAAKEDNRIYFNQLKNIFNSSATVRDTHPYNTDEAWEKVKSKLHGQTRSITPAPEAKTEFQWWKIAAALLVLVVAGLMLITRMSTGSSSQKDFIADKQAVSDTLPDGSNVFLNKKTHISYAFNDDKKMHEVRLEGEAYFNVDDRSEEQFIIRAGDTYIKDIGTSFNVKAYPETDVIEVLVEDGEIVFYTDNDPGIRLKESGRAVYNRKTKKFTIEQPDPNIVAYKTKFFVFNETTLGSAVANLNAVYDQKIEIAPHLANCPITASFHNEPIEEVAQVLAETLSLTVEMKNGVLFLNGEACE